jgi:hypothetical protein
MVRRMNCDPTLVASRFGRSAESLHSLLRARLLLLCPAHS